MDLFEQLRQSQITLNDITNFNQLLAQFEEVVEQHASRTKEIKHMMETVQKMKDGPQNPLQMLVARKAESLQEGIQAHLDELDRIDQEESSQLQGLHVLRDKLNLLKEVLA